MGDILNGPTAFIQQNRFSLPFKMRGRGKRGAGIYCSPAAGEANGDG